MGKAKDLTGQRFDRLVAVAPTEKRSGSSVVWECRCDCGNIKLVPGGHLTSGAVKSCGCLRKKKHEENKEELSGEKSRKVRNLEYPLNLWSDVLECRISPEELPEDWEPALDYVLGTLKTEKEKEILLYYYKDNLTLKAIGILYGVSKQAISHRLGSTVGMLRHPVRRVFFLNGLESRMATAEQTDANPQAVVNSLALCLSVRAWNCLINSGIDTIDKLQQCTEEDLAHLRNMGKASVDEIKANLARRGLSLREPGKENLTGMRFGMLTVVAPTEEKKHGNVIWECLCDCGNTKLVSEYRLTSGDAVDCGVCHRKRREPKVDLTGRRFGMLTVVAASDKRQAGNILWECRCDCGNTRYVAAYLLVRDKVKSCGCTPCKEIK